MSYLQACENSASRSDCECSLEFLEERLPEDEFIAEDTKMTAGQLPSDEFTKLLSEAIMTCLLKTITDDYDSSSSSSSFLDSGSAGVSLTHGEVEEHFTNWLCPGSPEFARSLVDFVFRMPFSSGWDVDIKHEGKLYVFEMSESTKKWVGSNQYSKERGASIRGMDGCK